jgi:hypothetical protein
LWSPATSFFIGSSSTNPIAHPAAAALLDFEGMADLHAWLAANV